MPDVDYPLTVLDVLTPGEKATLAAQCEAAGVALYRWREVEALRVAFELLALERLADELQGDGPRGAAEAEAARRLSIVHATHRSRKQSWRRAAAGG